MLEPLVIYIDTPKTPEEHRQQIQRAMEVMNTTNRKVVLAPLDDKAQVAVMQRMAKLEDACKAMLAAHNAVRDPVRIGKALQMASDALRGNTGHWGPSPMQGLFRKFRAELDANVEEARQGEILAAAGIKPIEISEQDAKYFKELERHMDEFEAQMTGKWSTDRLPLRESLPKAAKAIQEATKGQVQPRNHCPVSCPVCHSTNIELKNETRPIYDGSKLVDYEYRGVTLMCRKCGYSGPTPPTTKPLATMTVQAGEGRCKECNAGFGELHDLTKHVGHLGVDLNHDGTPAPVGCGEQKTISADDAARQGGWKPDPDGSGVWHRVAEGVVVDGHHRFAAMTETGQDAEFATFSIADTVRLKSTGQIMHVESVQIDGRLRCKWTKPSGLVERGTFAAEDVEESEDG